MIVNQMNSWDYGKSKMATLFFPALWKILSFHFCILLPTSVFKMT